MDHEFIILKFWDFLNGNVLASLTHFFNILRYSQKSWGHQNLTAYNRGEDAKFSFPSIGKKTVDNQDYLYNLATTDRMEMRFSFNFKLTPRIKLSTFPRYQTSIYVS